VQNAASAASAMDWRMRRRRRRRRRFEQQKPRCFLLQLALNMDPP
jgi:hypothetical protein